MPRCGATFDEDESPPPEGSCERIENRLLSALSVRGSARATQVERALRARFHRWTRRWDGSGLARFNFFTASGPGVGGGFETTTHPVWLCDRRRCASRPSRSY